MFEAIILGIVQGLTEFIPISSSGHLILIRDLFGFGLVGTLSFDAVLQLATTLSVLVYFRKDILKLIKTFLKIVKNETVEEKDSTMVYGIIIATIPAVIFGLLLEDYMDTVFRNIDLVAVTLLVGALIMWFADEFALQNRELNKKNSFVIGSFQSLALVPGMSRSGMTISGGLFMGLNRIEATRFAFLIAFPILFGSGLKKVLDLYASGQLNVIGFDVFIGAIVSFVVGLGAIHFLVKFLEKNTLKVFVWYRVLLAALIFFVL